MTGHTLDALSHIKFPGIYNNSKTQQDHKQIIMPMSLLINNNYVDNVFLFLYLHVLLYEHNTCSGRIQSLHDDIQYIQFTFSTKVDRHVITLSPQIRPPPTPKRSNKFTYYSSFTTCHFDLHTWKSWLPQCCYIQKI